MIPNYVARRLIAFIPLALAAILLVVIGPEKLDHLQARERWELLGCLLLAFIASTLLGRYLRPANAGASPGRKMLVGYAPPNRKFRNPVVLHSTLAPEAVADTLRRSMDVEGLPRYMVPWFIRLFRQASRHPFIGVVESRAFALRSRNGGPHAPTFSAKWEPEYSGTRIEGQFDLAPLVKLSLRISLIVTLSLSIIRMVLNALDLTARAHFTHDPHVGLVLCMVFVPLTVGLYFVLLKLGSRPDKNLLAFLERPLAASRAV
jgi:hypothetical protein